MMMGATVTYLLERPMTFGELMLWCACVSLFFWVLAISAICKFFLGG
jgi:hypothetical protein